MSIATPQELVGHAVAGDKLTDITDLKGALYNEVRKKTAKGFYQESLTKLEAESPLQNDKLRQVLNNFGTKIDDTTGEVKVDSVTDASGRSEQNLVDELKEEITLLEELSDKGFGALDAGKQDRIRDIVKERLQSNAAISKDLSEKGNLNTFITELIQSPAFLPKLKSIVNDHARDGELDSSFLDAYQAWKDAEAELNEEETKATHAQDRLNRVKIELRSYEKGENGFEGTLYRKMEDLKTQGTAPQEDIINIQGHIDELRVQVDKLERQTNQTITMPTSETPVALAAAHATLNTEQDTVNDYTKKIRDEREKTPPNQDFINDYNSRIAAAQEAGNAEELEHYKELLREETRKVGPNERLIETWQSQLRSATTRRDSAEAKLRSLEASQPQLGDTTSFDRIDSLRRQIRESERELAEKKASLND
ncbi:MAG: hypothetical protein Q7T54_04820, partial [Candidatus Levybacteria bacterium]|nr:hypothetical protein [Candidatus Levybacteria bacterium]